MPPLESPNAGPVALKVRPPGSVRPAVPGGLWGCAFGPRWRGLRRDTPWAPEAGESGGDAGSPTCSGGDGAAFADDMIDPVRRGRASTATRRCAVLEAGDGARGGLGRLFLPTVVVIVARVAADISTSSSSPLSSSRPALLHLLVGPFRENAVIVGRLRSSKGARSASPEASSPGPSSCPDIEKRWRVWRRGIGVIPSATGSDVRKVAALGLPKRTPFARRRRGPAPTPRRLAGGRDRRLRIRRLGVRVRCFGTTFSVCGEYA